MTNLYTWISHKLVNVWLLSGLARASEFMLFSKRQPNLKVRKETKSFMAVELYRPRFDTNRAKRVIGWADSIQPQFCLVLTFFVPSGLRFSTISSHYLVMSSLLRLQCWRELELSYLVRAGSLCEGDATIEKIWTMCKAENLKKWPLNMFIWPSNRRKCRRCIVMM